MALKIRLRVQGRNNRPFYRVVVADCRSPRDGKYVESIGWYNPFETELDKSFFIKLDRVQYWMGLGAQWSECLESLIARVSPELVKSETQKEVARRAKALAKRKARKAAAA